MATSESQSMTHGFSSAPRAVGSRRLYRDTPPSEFQRTTRSCNLMNDMRVHRGVTCTNLIRAANANKNTGPRPVGPATSKTKHGQLNLTPSNAIPSPFSIPLPHQSTLPVDLSPYLLEHCEELQTSECATQSDPFKPLSTDHYTLQVYIPQKSGIDIATQVENSQVFDFDREVEPILDVIVTKVVEQARLEVEEESEVRALALAHKRCIERGKLNRQMEARAEEEEAKRRADTERLIADQRKRTEAEHRVLLKITARQLPSLHFRSLLPNALADLQMSGAFSDPAEEAVMRNFLPSVFDDVFNIIANREEAEQLLDKIVAENVVRPWRISEDRPIREARPPARIPCAPRPRDPKESTSGEEPAPLPQAESGRQQEVADSGSRGGGASAGGEVTLLTPIA